MTGAIVFAICIAVALTEDILLFIIDKVLLAFAEVS